MERRLHVRVRGASPYGFRLVGGGGKPVSITKLRPRSKAADAGLMEGDEILSVNGCSCRDVSYERLIGLVEHAGHYLDLDIIRRAPAPPPGAVSRDRKWSYDRLDDVIASPKIVAARRWTSTSPTADYDNVFDRRDGVSPFVFERQPARRPLMESSAATAAAVSGPRRSRNDENAVSVVWNADKSVTMSVPLPDDVDSKENRQPAKQQHQSVPPRRHRNESFLILGSPPSPARVVSPSPPSRSLTHRVWTPRPASPPRPPRTERSAADLWLSSPPPPTPTPASSIDRAGFGPLPPDVLKIISPPSDDESLDSLLSPTHLAKRKKYGDSSFYDDDTQIYPTVEEQMKMARRIAQSLTSPANRNTRGQRMFLKRRERSVDWTVDETNRKRPSVDVVDAEDDLYYNPTPWTATATWKPRPRDLSSVPAAAAMSPIPQLFAPRVPPASTTDERARYMSADELERMRLFADKSRHDAVPPQLCFNLAADLRRSTSRGGRMFAKRRANADQWTVENSPLPPAPVTKPVIPAGRSSDEVRRPSAETSELPRAAMSPWDAAVRFGYVEPAFEHLRQPASTTSIPRPPTSQHRPNKLSTTVTYMSPTRDLMTSPLDGLNHISTDDVDEGHVTSHSYRHHHQPQQHLNDASLPWQRDVSETPSSVDAGYRPIHFSVQLPIDVIDH